MVGEHLRLSLLILSLCRYRCHDLSSILPTFRAVGCDMRLSALMDGKRAVAEGMKAYAYAIFGVHRSEFGSSPRAWGAY